MKELLDNVMEIAPLHPLDVNFSEVEVVRCGEDLIKVSFGGGLKLELHIPKEDISVLRDALNKIEE